jgi:hypothetical protein
MKYCSLQDARQALSIRNRLANPTDRAISHGNLSDYLEKTGKLDDSAGHLLAAVLYSFIGTRYDYLSL